MDSPVIELCAKRFDHIVQWLRLCRRRWLAKAHEILATVDGTKSRVRVLLPARFVQQEEKCDVVREYDDLPLEPFLGEPGSDFLPCM